MSDQNLYVYRVVQNYVDFDRPNTLILDFEKFSYHDYTIKNNFATDYKEYYGKFHADYPFDAILFVFANDPESNKQVVFLVTRNQMQQYDRNIYHDHLCIPISSFRHKKRSHRKKKSAARRKTVFKDLFI